MEKCNKAQLSESSIVASQSKSNLSSLPENSVENKESQGENIEETPEFDPVITVTAVR